MRVKFIMAWRTYRVGDIIDPPGTLRQWLIQSKFCVPIEERIETATAPAPVAAENAMRKRGKR